MKYMKYIHISFWINFIDTKDSIVRCMCFPSDGISLGKYREVLETNILV
jgi:hypothetical protein